jgi:signal peptidase II
MPDAGGARVWRGLFGVAVIVILADQLTKAAVVRWLPLHDSIPIVEGFLNLVHVRNPGAAFSLLADSPDWFRAPFFIVVTLVAVGFLLGVARRLEPGDRGLRTALGAVLGGAVGNLIDRLAYGEVVDFIDVYWGKYHWPAFNVADSCISVAVAAILLQSLQGTGVESPDGRSP